MDETSLERTQEAKVRDGFGAPFGMDPIPSQELAREDMQPVKFTRDANAGFVGVCHGGLREQAFDHGLKRAQLGLGVFAGGLNGSLTEGVFEEVLAHLPDALQRQELLHAAVDEPSEEARAVLGGGDHAGGKGSADFLFAARTELDFGPVLGDFQVQSRQFEDLPAFVA